MRFISILLCGVLLFAGIQAFGAQTLTVTTTKTTYNYGDYLGITISVSKVTGENAVMYIVDSEGKKSNAIPVLVQNTTTAIVSPNPFDSLIFKEGNYKIEIQYDGSTSFAEFMIVDAGNLVMPFGSNVVVPQWIDGAISDYALLKFLADKNVLVLSGVTLSEDIKIPLWYKTNAVWWSEKKISDAEFVNAIKYLLDRKVIN